MIRLDKFLSEMGVGTRQEVKQYIRKGKVEVDGEIAKRPELKVDDDKSKCYTGPLNESDMPLMYTIC